MTPERPMGAGGSEGEQDAFLRAVLRAVQWTQENTRTVTIGAVVVIGVVAAGLYYRNYRESLREQAAGRLQTLQAELLQSQSPSDTLRRSLQQFLNQYGDTRAGDQARLLMARIQLRRDQWQQAVSTLEPLTGRYPADSPTGYGARKLLAAAHEGAGNTERALSLYGELADQAQFAFQRYEAAANRARLLADQGRLADAESIYSRLVQEADTSDAGVTTANLQSYRVELGEVRARLTAADTTASGG